MRKLMMMIAAVMTMTLGAGTLAMAQSFEFEQEAESGDVSQVYQSSVSGYGNAVATDADFNANTGNYQVQDMLYYNGNVQYDNSN